MNKNIYINGAGNVSPQKTFDSSHFLEEVISVESNRLKCIDPNYREFVPADMVRRMSRIIKMGVAASKICLKDAGCDMPDAIITGTGLGCIEDTEKFLSSMIMNKEEFLTPTSFIQSTHNTVSAQIALLLKCHQYNFTYVHRGVSFESALIDSILRINSGKAANVLLGSTDELTQNSYLIMQRLGFWKRKSIVNLDLLHDQTRGTIAGEGSAFFLLSDVKKENTHSQIMDAETFLYPEGTAEAEIIIRNFLLRNDLDPDEIDLLITGMNGDPAGDHIYREISDHMFPGADQAYFKHLCGEYHTSVSFALWLAVMILKHHRIPQVIRIKEHAGRDVSRILIYNHYRKISHSLVLVSKT